MCNHMHVYIGTYHLSENRKFEGSFVRGDAPSGSIGTWTDRNGTRFKVAAAAVAREAMVSARPVWSVAP